MNININTIPDPVFIFDNTGMLIDTNEAFFQLIGFSIESNESPSLNDFAPQLYQEINKDIFVKSIYADKHLSYNTTINNKVGNEIIVKLSLSRITLRDESLFFSIVKVLGNEKEIQHDLESIIDSLGFGVLLIEKNKRISNINKYAFEFLGYESEDVVKGLKCCDIFCHIDESNCPVVNMDIEHSQVERNVLKKSGEAVSVLVDTRIINFRGQAMILESFVNIEKMKQAENELEIHRQILEKTIAERTKSLEQQREHLEKSQKALSFLLEDMDEAREELLIANQYMRAANQELESFSYSVSHDLRSPLTRMDGFSKALLELYGDKLDEKGHHYLKRIRASSQHMAELINDLLKLSRITRADINKQKIDISGISNKIIEELNETNSSRKVQFKVADNLIDIGDITLIKSLLDNLIGNAYKFTANNENAQIEIGKVYKNNIEFFFVKDNGVGFDMKYYNKLFSVFQRLHTSEEFPGTGIGLASVQRIINKHNGSIHAESEINKGTVFYFKLNG